MIDIVLYINLEHRHDRKSQIEDELAKIFPVEKIKRVDAIYDKTHGGKGCTKSHIRALKMAIELNVKNCMIVEDDLVWNKLEITRPILVSLLSKPYDVILPGSASLKYKAATYKILSAQTRTAYIVNQHYYAKLLSNFQEGLELFEKTNIYPLYAGDQYWKNLQKIDNWYAVVPVMCYQRDGYSDIQKKPQSYKNYSIT